MGWWFLGKWRRKLAHVWPGSDGLWRGATFDSYGTPSETFDTFLTEDAALQHYSELFTPKEKSA